MPAKPLITVVGSANIDFTMRVHSLPSRGETVTGGVFQRHFGGKGANQAVAAARAGGTTALVAAVGTDSLSQEMLVALRNDGLDLGYCQSLPQHPAGSALIMIDEQGENYLTVAAGANGALSPEHVDAAAPLLARSAWILLQMEIPVATNLRVLELAERHSVPVLHNYAPALQLDLPRDARIAGLVVNETEASALLGRSVDGDDPDRCREAATALRSAGHRFVVLTLGRHGSVLAHDQGCQHVPALEVEAVDSTAAGDTYCGALAVALGEGAPLEHAARFATAAAALAVSRPGAQPSIPHRGEIEALHCQVQGKVGKRL